MRNKILMLSTAALLAGTLAAAGQSIQPGGAGGAAQEKGEQGSVKSKEAPRAQAPKAGQMQREGQQTLKNETQGQAGREQDKQTGKTQGQADRDDKAKGKTQGQADRDDKAKGKTQGQAERDQDKQKIQTQGQAPRDQDSQKGKTQSQTDQDKRGPVQGQNQGDRDRVQGEREGRSSNTSVSFTSEQRTKIRETVFKEKNAPRVTNVNFSLNVGTVVPRTVHIIEVPEVIVSFHPEWRGYRYFIVNDEIVVVEPDTLKIVAVIDV